MSWKKYISMRNSDTLMERTKSLLRKDARMRQVEISEDCEDSLSISYTVTQCILIGSCIGACNALHRPIK